MAVEKNTEEELDLLTLSEAAKIAGFTPEYLNMLARKKKLQAMKIGRNWFTTQNWLNDFFHPELKTLDLVSEEEIKTGPDMDVPQESTSDLASESKKEKAPVANYENKFSQKESAKWWQSSRVFSLTVIVILIFFGTLQTIKIKQKLDNNNSGVIDQIQMELEKIETLDAADQEGEVLGTQTENIGRVLLASENYAIKEIKFGGDVSLLASSYENFPLKLTDVRSQIVTTKNKDEFQLLVYWKTNKLAVSSIAYSKMGADSSKKISEEDFGFSHSVIIPKLEPATAYTYIITAKDKWGNTITSDKYSAYTGAKDVSVFELIVKAAEDTFGWAMNK
ncbi:MAG: hypothetical protein WCX17_04290 [Parcubacteria group bacterium]|jgi:hypothetical protein